MKGRPKLGADDERTTRLHLRVSATEREWLAQSAAASNLPLTTFIRQVALGYEPKSTIDGDHIREVIRTRGDLGRVGGLLKLWLTERPEEGSPAADVRRVLEQLEEVMEEVRHKVREL